MRFLWRKISALNVLSSFIQWACKLSDKKGLQGHNNLVRIFSRNIKYNVIIFAMLSACSMGPDYKTPHLNLPSEWKNAGDVQNDPNKKEISPGQEVAIQENRIEKESSSLRKISSKVVDSSETLSTKDLEWWKTFKDPLLNDLVKEARTTNLDIEKAMATLRQARATLQSDEASLLPDITGKASFSKTRNSQSIPRGGAPTNQRLFTTEFDSSWEINLFGWKRVMESAEASVQSVIEDVRGVLVSVMAEVAQNYINLRFYQHQLSLLKQIVGLREHYLSLQKDLHQAGLLSHIDVQSIETSLSQARGQIGGVDSNLKSCLHQLGILLGKEPWALYERLQTPSDIPTTDTVVLSALPSTLLDNRPDMRKAERDLAVATANIGVSFASFFPSFLLTGNIGWQGTNTNQLFSPKSYTLTAGPSMNFPIFDFGRVRAQVALSEALRDEAFSTFKETVLTALQDVENSLVSFSNEDQRLHHLKEAMNADDKTYDLTQKRFVAGLDNKESVILSHITAVQSKIDYLNSLTVRSLNIVSVYKALGGGWATVQ